MAGKYWLPHQSKCPAAQSGPAAHQLLLALTARVQSLITTAIEVTGSLPPV